MSTSILKTLFLEDKLEFLDAPTEWLYDKTSKKIYLMTENGDSPENHVKVSTYAITMNNTSAWLVFSGLNFFGTTVYMNGESVHSNIHDITLDSLLQLPILQQENARLSCSSQHDHYLLQWTFDGKSRQLHYIQLHMRVR